MSEFFKNLVTFGAAGRIENAIDDYNKIYKKYTCNLEILNDRKKQCEKLAEEFVELQRAAQKYVQKLSVFTDIKSKEGREEFSMNTGIDISLISYTERSLSAGEAIFNTALGTAGATGLASAAPGTLMWAVTTFGTASTGTAISTLSGAAAQNAALACLGGGSIAAGGGGVAAGTSVLSAAVPIVAVVSFFIITPLFSHLSANKKIAKIESESLKISKELEKIEAGKLKLDYCINRIEELKKTLRKSLEAFIAQYKKTYKIIFPLGNISMKTRQLVSKLRKQTGICYTEKEQHALHNLFKSAKATLEIRDISMNQHNF